MTRKIFAIDFRRHDIEFIMRRAMARHFLAWFLSEASRYITYRHYVRKPHNKYRLQNTRICKYYLRLRASAHIDARHAAFEYLLSIYWYEIYAIYQLSLSPDVRQFLLHLLAGLYHYLIIRHACRKMQPHVPSSTLYIILCFPAENSLKIWRYHATFADIAHWLSIRFTSHDFSHSLLPIAFIWRPFMTTNYITDGRHACPHTKNMLDGVIGLTLTGIWLVNAWWLQSNRDI